MIKKIREIVRDPKGSFKKAYRWLELFEERLDRHQTFMMASGIAFNILLYLLPVFLILVLIIRVFLGSDGIVEVFSGLLFDFLPPTQETYSLLESVSKEVELLVKYSSVFGLIGGLSLLWLSSLLISAFRSALNEIYNIKSQYIFILYRFKDMLLTLVLTVLILIYSYAVPIVTYFINSFTHLLPEMFTGFISNLLLTLFSLLVSFLLIYFIYRWVPNQRIPRKPRVFATILTVIMIELSRHLFAWYISTVTDYGKFYGTYAVIVSIAIWVYYSSLIILLSAELGKYIYDNKWDRENLKEEPFEDSLYP
ncbi:MAG: YihY/virulence factor BrkB family protein [Candidatus Kapaibacterium sp.]|nr:YihY family inner membrane protein [Ignavibacteriota bacterium]MCB9222124.1 YihY family inner membrane protein [Ignavibacteria bacterium]